METLFRYRLEEAETTLIDKKYSKMLHSMFDDRQEFDYRELVEILMNDAISSVDCAKDFIAAVKKFINQPEKKA